MLGRIYEKLMETENFDDCVSLDLSKAEALFLMSVLLDYPEVLSKNLRLKEVVESLEKENEVLAQLCECDGEY